MPHDRQSRRFWFANACNAARHAKGRRPSWWPHQRTPQKARWLKKKGGSRAPAWWGNPAARGAALWALSEGFGGGQAANGGAPAYEAPIGGGIVNAAPAVNTNPLKQPSYIPGGKLPLP